MYSPTGYYAHYTLTPSGLPFVLPVAAFDPHDGDAQVCTRSGRLTWHSSHEILMEIGGRLEKVTPYGPAGEE